MLSENVYLSSTWKNLDGKDFFHLIHSQPKSSGPTALEPDNFIILDTTKPSANELKSSAGELDSSASELDSSASVLKSSASEFDSSANKLKSSASEFDSSASELQSMEIKETTERADFPKENEEDLSADMEDSIFYNQRDYPNNMNMPGEEQNEPNIPGENQNERNMSGENLNKMNMPGENRNKMNMPVRNTSNAKSVQGEDCRITPDTIFSTYPKLPAFLKYKECIRIEPQDIGILPMKHWGLAGNSFLLHGYYCFHHLLLARCENDSYILGVPGFYHQNEKIMATMFGFDSFGTINRNPHRNGDYGYYYRMIV